MFEDSIRRIIDDNIAALKDRLDRGRSEIPEEIKRFVTSEELQLGLFRLIRRVASFVDEHNILVPEVTFRSGPVEVVVTMRRVDDTAKKMSVSDTVPTTPSAFPEDIIVNRFLKKD